MSIISFSNTGKWADSFRFDQFKCLIVCRGPIRKEALEVFEELGAQPSGILLSEKDSLVYPKTLAPELRLIPQRKERVHHISDYTGATKEERSERVQEIIRICHEHHYTHLFAGYGFMAEDMEFIAAIEQAGIRFVGPQSSVVQQAGTKDEAKRLAGELGISVIPGVNNITALTLLAKAVDAGESYLKKLIETHNLTVAIGFGEASLEEKSELVLQASYGQGIDLISINELQRETEKQVERIWQQHPKDRIRFKHIGGGGGKGQRIVETPEQVADAVMEVLIESKATGVGDNKNFLIELNIEDTRHNEIQLLGNGEWCLALGGRDCSLQMHEQKLLELSLTPELLQAAAADYFTKGQEQLADIMLKDLEMLEYMCIEAESFGQAVKLDSASTFECIVAGTSHYFMEMNTRIQVEHRVTEMVYSLKFVNPDNAEEFFVLDSLVGAMLMIACHGIRVPKPERIPRYNSGVEARINAMNAALQPHAGGILQDWSSPAEGELRDDQGIGIRNPDTNLFQYYQLAGAYDANVALVVSSGKSRQENLEKLAGILRKMEVRGENVELNIDFHYGLLHWLIGNDAMLKPNTRFVWSYLAMVGKLHQIASPVNLEMAWKILRKSVIEATGGQGETILERKLNLLTRPLRQLLENPHLLSGWLSPKPKIRVKFENDEFQWMINPLEILNDLYHYLRLEERPGVPAGNKIWQADFQLLKTGLDFYQELKEHLGEPEMLWHRLEKILEETAPPQHQFSSELWEAIQASHQGFQLGLDLLKLPLAIAREASYFEFFSNDQLTVEVPALFRDHAQSEKLIHLLAPPPPASSDQIVSWSGGTFYSKETPNVAPYIQAGGHFEQGDVLGILEVMKMFNPLCAEFSGTVKKVIIDGSNGIVIPRGQVIFEVEPDVLPVDVSEKDVLDQQWRHTQKLMEW